MGSAVSPTFAQLVLYFVRLGATGFGGPVALANYIRKDLVERDAWFTEEEYDRGLAVATACPGPLAYQLGVYCGYVKYGVAGGAAVGVAFALAPFLIVVAVAVIYVHFWNAVWIRVCFTASVRSSLHSSSKRAGTSGSRH